MDEGLAVLLARGRVPELRLQVGRCRQHQPAIRRLVSYGIDGRAVGRADPSAVRRAGLVAMLLGIFLAMVLTLAVVAARFAIARFFLGGASTEADATIALAANLLLTRTVAPFTLHSSPFTLPRLALRNAGANRGRSLLIVGLLAGAAFLLVTVAANTRDDTHLDWTQRSAGTGGFARTMPRLPSSDSSSADSSPHS